MHFLAIARPSARRFILASCVALLGAAPAAKRPPADAPAGCPAAAAAPPAPRAVAPEPACDDEDVACWKRGCAAGSASGCIRTGDDARACELGSGSGCAEAAGAAPEEKRLALLERACRLGHARSCAAAAEEHAGAGEPGSDPCYTAFLERACALRDLRACALARLCSPPPSTQGPFPGRDVVEAFLRARSAKEARALVDEGLVRRGIALTVLADPAAIDPVGVGFAPEPEAVEELVDALLSAPEDEGGSVLHGECAVRAGTEADREMLAPVLYTAAASERIRTFIVETRARLDAAVPLVAACRCREEDLFLVDVARGRIVGQRVRALPPRTALIVDPTRRGPPVALRIEADAVGASIQRGRRTEPLPWRRDEAGAYEVVTAKLKAPGREPYALDRAPARQGGLGGVPGEMTWFVVLRPARAGPPGGR